MNKGLQLALAILLFLVLSGPVFSQQPSTISAEKIAENVYLVKGGVANTGFVIGDKEVVAIDAEMTAPSAKQMIDEIAKNTSKPLTKLILTHSDGDHVNGLLGFPKGLEIISSDAGKRELEEAFKAPNAQGLSAYLPTRTFAGTMDVGLGSEQIKLLYFGPAHTSGDIVVFLPGKKIAFVGDLVFIGRDPLIHRQKGGTSVGLVKTLQALLDLGADQYIPGHGEIATKSDISAEMKGIEEKQEKIRSMITEGKPLEEVKKAFGIADAPAGGMRFPSLVEVIFLEFSARK
jgi:cyclase